MEMKLWPMKTPVEYVLHFSRKINNAWQCSMYSIVIIVLAPLPCLPVRNKEQSKYVLISMIVLYTPWWAHNNTVMEKNERLQISSLQGQLPVRVAVAALNWRAMQVAYRIIEITQGNSVTDC